MYFYRAYLNRSDDKSFEETFGIFNDTVRLSVGIENIEDLIEDLEQALKKTSEWIQKMFQICKTIEKLWKWIQ